MKKKRYSLSVEAPTMTRQRCTYRRRSAGDLLLPVAWSLLLSLVAGGTTFVLFRTPKVTALWALIVFGITLIASTVNLMFGSFEDVLQEVEEVMGVDLGGDGIVGQPPAEREWARPVRLPVRSGEKGNQWTYFDMDITPQLIDFCKALQTEDIDTTFSEDGAALYQVKPAEFEKFRDELMGEKKAIKWKNPKHHQSGYIFREDMFNTVIDWVVSYPLPQEASAAQPTS